MRWDRINKMLDKEVQRETKRILAKAKAAMGLGNGNGHTNPIEAKAKRKAKTVDQTVALKRARQFHGQYLGLTRRLTDTQRAHVKAVRAQKGVRYAIKVAKKLRASA